MNREIKFRAWDAEHKIMTKSPINKINFAGQIHLHSGWADIEDPCYVLMQYIGLKDKNGTEIYEGDIVKWGDYLYEIIWDQEYAQFVHNSLSPDCHSDYFESNNNEAQEVIGNIYENPELLEKGVIDAED